MEQESLLQDIEAEIVLEDATTGQRFANYLLDAVVFYLIMVVVGIVWGLLDPEYFLARGDNDNFFGNIADRLLGMVIYAVVYMLIEGISKGRTIGKLITGTKAVNLDGSPITFETAIWRSLSRIVPFEPLSALGGNPWHDKWTKTRVIKVRK